MKQKETPSTIIATNNIEHIEFNIINHDNEDMENQYIKAIMLHYYMKKDKSNVYATFNKYFKHMNDEQFHIMFNEIIDYYAGKSIITGSQQIAKLLLPEPRFKASFVEKSLLEHGSHTKHK